MTDFEQKFIENPVYLKWIFNFNPDIDHYWEQYLLNHPDEKDRLLDLKDLLTDLKFSNASLNPFEKDELAQCRHCLHLCSNWSAYSVPDYQ